MISTDVQVFNIYLSALNLKKSIICNMQRVENSKNDKTSLFPQNKINEGKSS